MKARYLFFTVILVICLFTSVAAQAITPTYSGKLSSAYTATDPHGADGLILGTGAWVNDVNHPVEFSWAINQNSDTTWHYYYKLQVQQGNPSHLIVEATKDIFTIESITNAQIGGADGVMSPMSNVDVDNYNSGGSNPNMPGNLYGIKFDSLGSIGQTVQISFDSPILPVWGDFYSKDGNAGGDGTNSCWNAGFLETDPMDVYRNGSVNDHILRPDSVIPEPATLLSLAMGCAGTLLQVRRRRK